MNFKRPPKHPHQAKGLYKTLQTGAVPSSTMCPEDGSDAIHAQQLKDCLPKGLKVIKELEWKSEVPGFLPPSLDVVRGRHSAVQTRGSTCMDVQRPTFHVGYEAHYAGPTCYGRERDV